MTLILLLFADFLIQLILNPCREFTVRNLNIYYWNADDADFTEIR